MADRMTSVSHTIIFVTPGPVPGAREHEPDTLSLGATISPSVFPRPRDKPGGGELNRRRGQARLRDGAGYTVDRV